MRSKKLSPRKATTQEKILTLKRDNISFNGSDILVHASYVSLWGEPTNPEYVRIPRKAFHKIIDWYNKEQSIE